MGRDLIESKLKKRKVSYMLKGFTTYVSSEVLFELFPVESLMLVLTDVELVDNGLTVAYALTKS